MDILSANLDAASPEREYPVLKKAVLQNHHSCESEKPWSQENPAKKHNCNNDENHSRDIIFWLRHLMNVNIYAEIFPAGLQKNKPFLVETVYLFIRILS